MVLTVAPTSWGDNVYGIASVVLFIALTSRAALNVYRLNAPVVPPVAVNDGTLCTPVPGIPVWLNTTRDV